MTSTPSLAGGLIGLAAGAGALVVASWLAARRPRPLAHRLSGVLPVRGTRPRPDATLGFRDLTAWALGPTLARRDTRDLALLMRRAGVAPDATAHRLERAAWAGAAAVAGLLAGLLLQPASALGPVLAVMAATGGAWGCDHRLRRRARRRQQRMAAQLPLLADLTSLAVTAGVGPVAALTTAAETMGGPLADELDRSVSRMRAGESADRALRDLAALVAAPGLHRLVESLLVAVDHGTPLAGVARAQADDLRADERRRLLESAGRRDIAMLVPIVVLVLPSVVLVALYPGLQALRVLVP